MALDEPREGDEIFNDRDLNYVIEKDLYEQIKPVEVDYVNSPLGGGFSISSNMKTGSACGSSCSC